MPFKDPERRRQYNKEYVRQRRAGFEPVVKPGCQTLVPAEVRVQTASDILNILSEQVASLRTDQGVKSTEKARTIGYLCAIALKAVQTATMEERLAALEEMLREAC